jgi:hypothetical protein
MKHRRHLLALFSLAAAALGAASPAAAQQVGGDRVAFRATVGGPITPFFTVPLDPPIAVASNTVTGQSDLLGAVTFHLTGRVHFGADGTPTRETDGLGVFTAANGDALYLTFSGLLRATATGLMGEQFFTITGGKGRFLGASGSGSWRGSVDASNKLTLQIEGVVSRPKP